MFDEESQLDSSEAKQEGHTKRLRSKSANIVEKDQRYIKIKEKPQLLRIEEKEHKEENEDYFNDEYNFYKILKGSHEKIAKSN